MRIPFPNACQISEHPSAIRACSPKQQRRQMIQVVLPYWDRVPAANIDVPDVRHVPLGEVAMQPLAHAERPGVLIAA